MPSTRREHLVQIGMAIPFSALPLFGQTTFTVLDSISATEIEALAAQIIPSDDSPGARKARFIFSLIQHSTVSTKTSAVDVDNRATEVPNLFLVDGSSSQAWGTTLAACSLPQLPQLAVATIQWWI